MENWNVLFFVRGFPEKNRFRDKHYFMSPPSDEMRSHFFDVLQRFPEIQPFFKDGSKKDLLCIGIVVAAKGRDAALGAAYDQLHGFICGVSLFLDHSIPKVCELCLCHPSLEDEAELVNKEGLHKSSLHTGRGPLICL
ncbi:hypothetical protein M0Q28_06660 [Patescibacteria group bacterium]|jgi:hypothetical protein|nr:hypothetical protein [Patescibacteria group bacterium]